MKNIIDSINESKNVKFESNVSFNLKSDIYNALGEIAYQYELARKGDFDDKRTVAAALDYFMDKFYDED